MTGANDDVHDQVAAKIAAHRAAILSDLQKPRRRKAKGATRRGRSKVVNVDQPRLFGGMAEVRTESFGQTRDRLSAHTLLPRKPLPVLRQREVRCVDCDYRLVARSGRVICPKCGQIFGDAPTLRVLRDAFGTIEFTNDDGAT